MDEVAALPVEAAPIAGEGKADPSLIGWVAGRVSTQFFKPVSKLAPSTVGTEALLSKVATEGVLDLGIHVWDDAGVARQQPRVVTLRRCIQTVVLLLGEAGQQVRMCCVEVHKNNYR
jgi:hypothetical protein